MVVVPLDDPLLVVGAEDAARIAKGHIGLLAGTRVATSTPAASAAGLAVGGAALAQSDTRGAIGAHTQADTPCTVWQEHVSYC